MFMKSKDIRKTFICFFESKDHILIKSSSLVPKNNSSLLFTNAGMNQFTKYFLNIKCLDQKNVISIQRCLRISGKHNDFENVGYTSRHNTFFEMMGNFSFGTYFKEEAILYSWDLLTNKNLFSLNKNRFIVTVHKDDILSYNIWKNIIKLSDNKIFISKDSINNSDNFWRVDNLGLCGYSTEIFYVFNNKFNDIKYFNLYKHTNNYLELWNLVFLEFNFYNNKYNLLLNKCVDTGIGLERLASILQGVSSNFEIDTFINIKNIISDVLLIKINISNLHIFNVISDHIRSIIYLLIDDVLPSNTYRGYVLRKIIRRTIVHIRLLKINDLILYKLLKFILFNINEFKDLNIKIINKIVYIVYKEEKHFLNSLSNSLNLLNFYINKLNYKKYLSSKIVFLLYDTYGLPLDIIIDVCKYNNIIVNLDKFNKKLIIQKEKSKKNNLFINKFFKNINLCDLSITKFFGFNNKNISSKILLIFNNNNILNFTVKYCECSIILNNTVLFPELAGQCGDIGFITKLDNSAKFIVNKTIIYNEYIIHIGYINYGVFKVGDLVDVCYDVDYRYIMSSNHTCLHILCFVLKKLLNKDCIKKGSYINKDSFRLDFFYNKNINNYLIKNIENKVNKYIQKSLVIRERFKYNIKNDILKCNFFGKNIIRVIKIDNLYEENCCGTHVSNTRDIFLFSIVKIINVSSNIKRIKAKTYLNAFNYLFNCKFYIKKITKYLFTNIYSVYEKIFNLKNKYIILKNKYKSINKYNVDNIVNFISLKDFYKIKKYKCLFKIIKFNLDFNKNIVFNVLNKLYVKFNLKLIVLNLIVKDKNYFLLLYENLILSKFINFDNKIKNLIQNNYGYEKYWIISNNNFIINIYFKNYVNINEYFIFDKLIKYIKKNLII